MTATTEDRPLLTVPEAAEIARVSVDTVYRAVRADQQFLGVPVVRLGESQRHIRIPRRRLEAALGIEPEPTT